jgi:phosphoribosylformylglycinamidine synthase
MSHLATTGFRAAVVRFPGSNCDQDAHFALRLCGFSPEYVWHKEPSIDGFDLIVLPGGFSYGDYLRCGAIARYSPVMRSVIEQARRGVLVIGICNGFQVLCEAGLLPGALIRNRDLHFICEYRHLRVENVENPFLQGAAVGGVLRIPIAHGEGNYQADAETLDTLEGEGRILLRYCDARGEVTDSGNPNGASRNIAGICNADRNVMGMMPHPERACEPELGSEDGLVIFRSIQNALAGQTLIL